MSTLLIILQVVLALHTLMGAVWKFTNTIDAVPTLRALGNPVWRVLGVVEVAFVLMLTLPLFIDGLGRLPVFGALGIALEMGVFGVVHLKSGSLERGPLIYWSVVAALSVFIAVMLF